MGPAAFTDGKLVTRKSYRKKPDPGPCLLRAQALGGGGVTQLHGAAAESQHRCWDGGKGRDRLWEPRTLPRDQGGEEGTI